MSLKREAYEKYNIERLNKVLKCSNLPTENEVLPMLIKYSKKKKDTRGVKIVYKQKNNFGRYCCEGGIGLQFIQKDIRRYISGEYYDDIDIENCHPVLLNQITQKNGMYNEYLDKYVKSREECLTEWNVTKNEFLSMINYKCSPINPFLKIIHDSIYGNDKICSKLIKENKQFFTYIKKIAKGDFNYEGAFMSHYLQKIENDILLVICDYINSIGYKVGVLMFDGLMIEKSDTIESEFENIEKEVELKTGYKIKLVKKSMETEWEPIVTESIEYIEECSEGESYSISKNRELYNDCFVEDEKGKLIFDYEAIRIMVEYLNKFICKVNNPHSYGFRLNTNDVFDLRSSEKVADRIRYGFENKMIRPLSWKDSDYALTYNKFVFKVNEKTLKKDEYNLYKRPEMEETDDSILKIEFFNYLRTIISNGDERVYFYLINYIAKMVQVGKTKQAIVLLGRMGTGKSSLAICLSHIIGTEYLNPLSSIQDLSKNFNALSEKCILTQVEEVDSAAGEYHKIQNILKTFITEDLLRIEKKGLDAYIVESNNNFIFLTNRYNPIEITKDNRRYLVTRPSSIRLGDYNYFKTMTEELQENIKKVRYYFYNYKFEDNLNSIRPTTDAELSLLYLNMKSEDAFIQTKLVLNGAENDDKREFQNVYNEYLSFCREINKKALNQPYFSMALKQYEYDIKRITKDGVKSTYIQGYTENTDE